MSRSTTEERVQHALSQLLERIIPVVSEEDEAANDERFDDAFQFALTTIERAGDAPLSPDVNHASDLIKKKLVREYSTPDKALRFSNLYSKLLTQPVLNQKWAMLYFLYHLSDLNHFPSLDTAREQPIPFSASANGYGAAAPMSPSTFAGDRQKVVESTAFNEAFSNPGLVKLPVPELQAQREQVPERTGRPERTRERKAPDIAAESDSDVAQPQQQVYDAVGPSESELLRDLPFTLQGLSSTNLAFQKSLSIKLPETLPAPLISLLHTLAEPSLLCRGLSKFVESSEGGLVGQSFRSAIERELRSYLGLVATLEGQIRRALAQLDDAQPRLGIGKVGVTLKRCVIWTREATMGLRLMTLMVEKSKGKKGGELISLIHSFSLSHGDPFVQNFAERLLSHVTRPFYDMLRTWIYDGELADPFGEFFVIANKDYHADADDKKDMATSVWADKYLLDAHMIPSIITRDFATKVFLIGKSLNFIRHGCDDAGWVESYSKTSSAELRYGDTARLSRSIGEAYETTMARLIQLMSDKFHLFEHLHALKRYLLLGSGDFVAVLMESLAANLDRPANTQYRHMLTAQLEHAVRSSNAQFESPDVLRRLDARMLELSHGEIGWDVFTLEYKVSPPVDVIVTPHASKQYLKVFNFLWRVKRVEFALGSTWRRCMTGARGILGSPAVEARLGRDWKLARAKAAEMIHFVNQLQYYILFEVIESSWTELQARMRRPESTLDDLIDAHAAYLNSITRKGLLGSSSKPPPPPSAKDADLGSSKDTAEPSAATAPPTHHNHTPVDFTAQLHDLLKTMLAYADALATLYSTSVALFTAAQDRAARVDARTAAGKWGLSERPSSSSPPAPAQTHGGDPDDPGVEESVIPPLRARLRALGDRFSARVAALLGDLAAQPDADMRWLAMVMNFNDVYAPVRRRRKGAGGGAAGAGTADRGAGRRAAEGDVTPIAGGGGGEKG